MVLLRMVRFIKDEEVDLFHLDVCIKQALMKNFCSANNHHVLFQKLIPSLSAPKVSTQSSE